MIKIKSYIKIDVIDNDTGKKILENATIKEASEKLGISYFGVNYALKNNSLVKKKYVVIQTGTFFEFKPIKDNSFDEFAFKIDWDKARFLLNPNARR